MVSRTLKQLLGAVLLAATVAACGDDAADVPELMTISEMALATPELETLGQALDAAGLTSTLDGAGPFTVFAPRDAAFDALGAEVVAGLLEDGNLELLSRILTFHVVAGTAVFSSRLTEGQTLTTVEGGALTVGVSGSAVTVNGVGVIDPDVEASNGVIHFIDGVLLPETDVYETAVVTPGTTTLAASVLAAELNDDLGAAGPLTVFAPVNSAFEALDEYTLLALFDADNRALLQRVLGVHVIVGAEVMSADLTDGGTATTLEGGDITFDLTDPSDPKVNGVSITATDIEVSNGVIHLVDEVILPELDIVETAKLTSATATLVDALVAGGLDDDLAGPGPFTVFAPVNGGFEALGESTTANLLQPANQGILADVLTYHVIAGQEVRAADLVDGAQVTTLEGGDVTIDLSDPSDPKVNGVSITVTDIETSNGVIHLIDGVLTESMNVVERATVTLLTSTLVDAVVAASTNGSTDVAGILSGAGPYTVFAPIDDAFEALGTDRLDVLLDPANADLLAKVLTYHAIPGDIREADLTDGATVATLEGTDVTIDLTDPFVPKVNGVNIIATDIVTENGVIHLIDGVLTDNLDIVDVATVEGFPTLVGLVDQQGLTTTLRDANGGNGWTVFAPTEDAFAALGGNVPTGQALTDILSYHVLDSEVPSSALSDGLVVSNTVNGASFTVNISGSDVTITDQAGNTVGVVATDVEAANGIIHVIDGVILPN